MKIGLASDEDGVIAGPGFVEQMAAAATGIKTFLCGAGKPPKSEAWRCGYNAFHDGVKANPYAPETDAHKDWELGSKAFDEDFEW